MTDQIDPNLITDSTGRDALVVEVIDSSPLGAIYTDGEFRTIHTSSQAVKLLGLDVSSGLLPQLIRNSRAMRPDVFTSFLKSLDQDSGPVTTHQLVESEAGEPRCVKIDVVRTRQPEARWLFWLDDVTARSHLQQYELLAELGSGRLGRDLSTQRLADRLVDSAVDVLGADIAVLTLRERDTLRPVATRGLLLEDGFSVDVPSRPYLAKAVESQRPVVSDGSEWDAADQEMTGSHYIVPLVASGEVLGTLHLSVLEERLSPNTIGFSRALDIAFLEVLSVYAGAALANMRLFEEVRAERLRLRTVVDYMPDGVILFTGRGDVLSVNGAAEEVSGRPWHNMNTDSRPYRLLSEDGVSLRRFDWPFFRPQRDGKAILGEIVQLDFGDHRKIVSVNCIPVPPVSEDAIPTYVGTMRDVTQERAQAAEQHDFLQVVSHELRGPLTPLTGFLQMVRKQAESGAGVDAELLARAEQQVARLVRLIDRVLDLSRLERVVDLEIETVDLRDIVRNTALLWANHPSEVSIELDCPDRPVWVMGDVDRLEQIMTNLLSNAVQHSPACSTVTVSVDETDEPRITVRDCGEGVPPEDLPHIFERFFSGRRKRGGMGIGLYITRHLVQAHGGTIRVRSRVDAGTTFEVKLPALPH